MESEQEKKELLNYIKVAKEMQELLYEALGRGVRKKFEGLESSELISQYSNNELAEQYAQARSKFDKLKKALNINNDLTFNFPEDGVFKIMLINKNANL